MAEDSENSNLIKLEKDEAIGLISAALQGGALKLPFAASFRADHRVQRGMKFLSPSCGNENVTLKEVVDGKVMDNL